MAPKKVKAGIGAISFEWENWMKDDKADIKRIKKIIDSWVIDIEIGSEDISKEEIQSFFKVMRGYGHLAKLKGEKEYIEKYKKIKQFYENNWGGPSVRTIRMR